MNDVKGMKEDPNRPGKHIDPETGIWPICEWGASCGRGFVSSERFATHGEQVIKRTNRNITRKNGFGAAPKVTS